MAQALGPTVTRSMLWYYSPRKTLCLRWCVNSSTHKSSSRVGLGGRAESDDDKEANDDGGGGGGGGGGSGAISFSRLACKSHSNLLSFSKLWTCCVNCVIAISSCSTMRRASSLGDTIVGGMPGSVFTRCLVDFNWSFSARFSAYGVLTSWRSKHTYI